MTPGQALLSGFGLGLAFAAGALAVAWAAWRVTSTRRADAALPKAPLESLLTQVVRDHQRDQQALIVERDRVQAVLTGMSEGVLAFDRNGRVTQVNPAALPLTGRASIPVGTPLAAFSDIPRLRSTTVAALRGQSSTRELEVPGPPPRHVLVRATPAPATGGCVVVMLDVTVLRRMERAQRDFVSNVSHELRTPIAVVLSNAETLVDGAIDDLSVRDPFLDGILRHARRMAAVIHDLLDLAKIESGRYALDPDDIEVLDVVHAAAEAMTDRASTHGRAPRLHVEPGLLVQADPGALEHILVNLLDNAFKYAGPEAEVAVYARPALGVVRLEVRDDGPGIPEEHRPRIFERFYRVDAGRSRDQGGTGLGLAIVKHLAEAMGGEVGVEANVPRGTVFWVALRRAVPV